MPNAHLQSAMFVHAAVDADELYDTTLEAMLAFDSNMSGFTDVSKVEQPVTITPGLWMKSPVGLSTKAMVLYKPDGAPALDEADALLQRAACRNPECKPENHFPAHRLMVAFETHVDYNDVRRNWNCGQLHAALLFKLGAWLDDRGIPWSWTSEADDTVHNGYDGLNELGEKSKEYNLRQAYEYAMATMPPVPMNSVMGLMIMADQVAMRAAADTDDEDDEPEDDRYAPYYPEDDD
jgi:hypothetical protein